MRAPGLTYAAQVGFAKCSRCDYDPTSPKVFVKIASYVGWIRPRIRH